MPSLGSLIAKVTLDYSEAELGADRTSQAVLKMADDVTRAVTKAVSGYKKSVGDMSSANDDIAASVARATAGATALAETEEQATQRIREMVARSREAQAALNDTAGASNQAAAGIAAIGASADQVRTNIAAQTAAMSATSREMAAMSGELETLRTVAAQGGASFETLADQYGRLDRLMASGKLSMEEYDATLAKLGKDEDRRLTQLYALTSRYDPLGAATRKLASDQALLDDAYKSGQISTDQYQKSLAGIKADQAAVQLRGLMEQEAQLERSFKSGQISAADYKKALADIKVGKSGLTDLAAGASAGASAMDTLGLHTASARKEIVVLAHEAVTGSWSNFGGSLMVLAERMDIISALTSPLALGIAAVGAAAYATYSVIESANKRVDAFNDAMNTTSGYAGQTRESVQALAESLSGRFGVSVGSATDDLNKMIATGKVSGDLFDSVATVAVAMAQSTGESFDKVLDGLLKQQENVSKAAEEYQAAHHTMTDAQLQLIEQLEKTGQKHTAFALLIQQEEDDIAKTTRTKTSLMAGYWDDVKASWDRYTRALSGNSTELDKLNDLKAKQAAQQSGKTANYDYTDYGPAIAAQQKIVDSQRAEQKQAEDQNGLNAKLSESQAAVTKQLERTMSPQQKLTEAIKNDNAIIDNRINLLKQSGKYTEAEAASLEKARQQMIAYDTKKDTPHQRASSEGVIDKTQMEGDVQAVKDALAEQLAAVSSSQKQLDAQYKSGGMSMDDYYTKSRALIMEKASDVAAAYDKEADILQKGLNNQKLSGAQRATIINQVADLHAKASKAIEDGMNGVATSAAEEDAVWQKYAASQIEATNKQADSAEKQDQQLKDQIATFGMTKSAIDDLVVSRTQNQLAMEQEGLAQAMLNGAAPDVIASYEKQIDALKRLLKAQQDVASDQSILDQKEAEKKVADQAVQDWKSAANSIEQGLTTALMNGFDHGKSFGQSLADSLKSLFKTLILQPIIAPIAGSMASLMYPGAAQAYARTNPNSPLVSLTSGGGLYSSANGLISSASSLFGGMSTGTAANIANAEGGDTLGNFLSLTGNAGKGAGTAGNAFSSVSSFLGAAGTGYGVGSIVGNLFGGGTAGTGSQVGGTVGGVAGSFIPIPGGTLIGSAIGSALGGLVGSLFGGGETRSGATYTTDGTAATKVGTGPSGGDPASEQVTSQINSTFQTIQSMATSLGGSIADLGTYHAGYEVSPKKGNSFVTAGFTTDPNEWDPGRVDLGGVKDSTTVLNDLSLQLQRSVIKSLQDASLDKPYADYLSQFDASSLSSDQVTQIESVLNELKSLFTAIQTMGSDFDNLKSASTDAQLAVVNLSGGIDQFNTNASYFEQNFVPAAEQTANQAKAVKDQLAALGESSVTTNEQFRQAVEGIDLSTAAGQQLYAQMLALAPAFNTMTQAAAAAQQAAQEAADQQQSLWNNYYSAIYSSDQQAAVAQGQLKAQFDALGVAMPKTNAEFQALVENMDTSSQPMKDLQNALLALAPTFGQVASAAEQSTATMQAAIGQAQKTAISTLSSSAQSLYTDKSNASSLLGTINSSLTGNDADTSSQISALWSEMTGGGVSLTQQIDLATQLNDLITKRYQAEGQAVSTLTDQVKQLRDYVQSLKAGDLSTETPSEKLADAAQLYADTLAKAQGGDQTAIGNLTTAADSYLKLAQTYYASSDTYTQIFASVTSQLSAFGDALDSQSKSSDQLSQESLDQLTKLRDIVAGQASSADSQYQGVMGQLAQQLSTLDAIEQAAGIQSEVPSILQGLPSEIAAQLASIIGTGTATGGDQITSLYQSMLGRTPTANEVSYWTDSFANGSKTLSDFKYSADQELINDAYQQILGRAADSGGLQFYTDRLYNGSETLDQIKSDLQNAKLTGAYATGGLAPAGLALVGENGPEIVDFKSPGRVYTNDELSSALQPIDYSKYGTGANAALVSGIKALHDRIGQLESALVQATQQNAAVVAEATSRSAQTISESTTKAAEINLRTTSAKPALV